MASRIRHSALFVVFRANVLLISKQINSHGLVRSRFVSGYDKFRCLDFNAVKGQYMLNSFAPHDEIRMY